MKKVLLGLVLVLGTLVSNGQTDTTGFANKIVEIFKKDVVDISFKDPYSFQLLSVKYFPSTKENELKYKIMSDSIQFSVYKDNKSLYKKYGPDLIKSIESNKITLSELSETEKNKIDHYFVNIECRGANSYGNLVYSKYYGRYYIETNSVDKFFK